MRTREEQIEKITEAVKDYTLLHTYGDDGHGYPLIDTLTPDGRTVDIGESECGELAAELYDSVIAPHILEAAARGIAAIKSSTKTAQEDERPDIRKWQEDQKEWFDPTVREIVAEYAAWRDQQDHSQLLKQESLSNKAEQRVRAEIGRVANDVISERNRQSEVEGFSADRDDLYTDFQLSRAASVYAQIAGYSNAARNAQAYIGHSQWPWDYVWLKPTTRRHDLVKAAALLFAEIERLDREAIDAAREVG